MGGRTAAAQGRLDGAGLALPAVLGRRPLRDRALLPYPNALAVETRGGRTRLDGDFGPRARRHGGEWPPFRPFGELYYTYQLSLDLKVEEGFAIRTEPHPRFYTDPTHTTPIAVPALIRRWWPMTYFLVFKSPPEGGVHVFRPGEPFAQILVVPEEADFELVPMPEEEAAERELQSRAHLPEPQDACPRKANGSRRPTPSSTGPTATFSGAAAERARRARLRPRAFSARQRDDAIRAPQGAGSGQ